MKTNILVQYRGGGYDGCIWEGNYFYIDKQGTFHNIQSSGCAGIDNKQNAMELIEQDKDSTYVYDLDNKQDIGAFSRESHAAHVSGVLQWFEDNPDTGVEFFAVCSVCSGHVDTDDLIVEGQEIMCYNCFSLGKCPCCEYYVGVDEMIGVDSDEHHNHSYICSGCKKYHDEEREQEQLEDLRFQSFCTGKPDMFSGELREQRMLTGGGDVIW